MKFREAKKRVVGALKPYKDQIRGKKDYGGGIIARLLTIFRNQPAHHIDLLMREALSELRNNAPYGDDIPEDAVERIIDKYRKRAEATVREFSHLDDR